MKAIRLCLLAFLVVSSSLPADAKVVVGDFRLSSTDTEAYVTKFSFSTERVGIIRANFTTDHEYFAGQPHDLRISVFSEQSWAKYTRAVEEGSLCRDRLQWASVSQQLTSAHLTGQSPFLAPVDIKKMRKSHFWYVFVSDCMLEGKLTS